MRKWGIAAAALIAVAAGSGQAATASASSATWECTQLAESGSGGTWACWDGSRMWYVDCSKKCTYTPMLTEAKDEELPS
ncbi:MAG TPA: hypothetical protein VGB92_10835 [Longimicrobium sp.]|jgi:hypothetical protein